MTVQVVRGGGALMTILGLLLASDSNGQGPGRPMAGWPDILISRTG
jgi:hypothetical protein